MYRSLEMAFNNQSQLTETELKLYGMSGRQFRHFYNNLGALIPEIHYLEIGIYAGSTMVSLLAGNAANVKTVVGIDYWDDGDVLGDPHGGMTKVKVMFDEVLPRYTTSTQDIHIMHADCRRVSPDSLLELIGTKRFNLYLFDGPHDVKDHFLAIVNYFPVLSDTFILVVDDWNWQMVRAGTETALTALSDQLVVLGKIELLTGDHPIVDGVPWHNGMAVFVIQKLYLQTVNVDAV